MWLVAFLHQYKLQTLIRHELFFRLNIKAAAFIIFYNDITYFFIFLFNVHLLKTGVGFEKFIYLFLTYKLKLSFKLKIKQKGLISFIASKIVVLLMKKVYVKEIAYFLLAESI